MFNEINYLYTYVLNWNTGLAPNYGFNEEGKRFCTLACCKPGIRKSIGYICKKINKKEIKCKNIWVMAISGKDMLSSDDDFKNDNGKIDYKKYHRKLVYLMQVTEVLTFDEYYKDKRFSFKKLQKGYRYGDNRYDDSFIKFMNEIETSNKKIQDYVQSYNIQKTEIIKNICDADDHNTIDLIKHDIKGEYVLVSDNYFYPKCKINIFSDIVNEYLQKIRTKYFYNSNNDQIFEHIKYDLNKNKEELIRLKHKFIENNQCNTIKGCH